MQPLISIVLCTYNGELFLKEQIDSLLTQTYTNIELIIADDSSTDSTPLLLGKYAVLPNVKVFYNDKNLGITANISIALKHCEGKFIALSDQDDIWNKDKIQIMYENIKDDLLVYSDSELVDENAHLLNIKLSKLRKMHTGKNVLGFAFNNCIWGHTILFRSELLDKILPIPNNIPHDSWIGFVAASEKRIRFLDIPLTLYRQHQKTFTSTLPKARYKSNKHDKQQDYLKRLLWIKALAEYTNNPQKKEYQKLLKLYKRVQKGKFVFPLYIFLLQHFDSIFLFSKKNFISKLNEARKISRGIKIHDLPFDEN